MTTGTPGLPGMTMADTSRACAGVPQASPPAEETTATTTHPILPIAMPLIPQAAATSMVFFSEMMKPPLKAALIRGIMLIERYRGIGDGFAVCAPRRRNGRYCAVALNDATTAGASMRFVNVSWMLQSEIL